LRLERFPQARPARSISRAKTGQLGLVWTACIRLDSLSRR
jgi:hypothetical protein